MISNENIKSIAAEKGVMDIVIEKDYVLDWILWGISQNDSIKNNLIFKGGTCLHKMYFSDWRFSEDLDFTSVHYVNKVELRSSLFLLCEQVSNKSGMNINLKELEASGDTGKEWSYEVKLEYIGPRGQAGGNLPTVLLHITNDEPLLYEPVKKIILKPYGEIPGNFVILTYSIDEILAEKLRTVFYQRCHPRDVYDLWRLLKEISDYIDIDRLIHVFKKKCQHRGIDNDGIPENIHERIERLRNQWKEGLQRQIAAPPDFESVYAELFENLKSLFYRYNILAKGGVYMIESTYVLRYKKGDLEIEVQGDKTFVEEKFKELLNLEVELTPRRDSSGEKIRAQSEKDLSLVEFVRGKNPKSHGDKILVFGYYLEKLRQYESFNLEDVEKCYQDARMPKTKNFSPYITRLIRQGYLMDSTEKKDNKKAWRLTKDGIDYVEKYEKSTD